ncbi:hypothetical protein [Candidatus Sororendozoicomonas aggregata]|uniref:hypothetical protein n=1 Tax=Candidatus Sororendozoicomonas aggregata TaxID=3073239 RepID=UPI002ED2C5D7
MDPLQRSGQTTQRYDQPEEKGRAFGKTVKKHHVILRFLKRGWDKFRHSQLIGLFFPAKMSHSHPSRSKPQRQAYVPNVLGMTPEEVKHIHAINKKPLPTRPVTTPKRPQDHKKALLRAMAKHAQAFEGEGKLVNTADILEVLNRAAKMDTPGGRTAREFLNRYNAVFKKRS